MAPLLSYYPSLRPLVLSHLPHPFDQSIAISIAISIAVPIDHSTVRSHIPTPLSTISVLHLMYAVRVVSVEVFLAVRLEACCQTKVSKLLSKAQKVRKGSMSQNSTRERSSAPRLCCSTQPV